MPHFPTVWFAFLQRTTTWSQYCGVSTLLNEWTKHETSKPMQRCQSTVCSSTEVSTAKKVENLGWRRLLRCFFSRFTANHWSNGSDRILLIHAFFSKLLIPMLVRCALHSLNVSIKFLTVAPIFFACRGNDAAVQTASAMICVGRFLLATEGHLWNKKISETGKSRISTHFLC